MFLNAATIGLVISLANPQRGKSNPTRTNEIKYGFATTCVESDKNLFILF
jgi:hypothetical protein